MELGVTAALGLATLVVGIAAAVEDLLRRRVSNWISGAAVASGIAFHTAEGGWRGLGVAVTGAAVGFGVFLIFYLLNGLGGGDVKLMAGFGSLLGPRAILWAAWIAAVAGGLLASVFAARVAIRKRANRGAKHAAVSEAVPRPAGDAIPYAPVIVLGVWLVKFGLG